MERRWVLSWEFCDFVVEEYFLASKDSSCVDISALAEKAFRIQPYCSVWIVTK